MHTFGIVRTLVADKGFGFIRDDQGDEYFFHRTACHGQEFDSLREGDQVSFTASASAKGPRAEDVRAALSRS